MEWLFDRFEARTTKIWLFEATRALGTAAAAKAPRDCVVFQNKNVSWKSFRATAQGGLPKTLESTVDEEWSPSPLPSVSMRLKGVPG